MDANELITWCLDFARWPVNEAGGTARKGQLKSQLGGDEIITGFDLLVPMNYAKLSHTDGL